MNQNQNPLFKTKKPKRFKKRSNFAEALLEIGGRTVKSFGKDFIADTADQAVKTFTNTGTPPKSISGEISPDQGIDIQDTLKQQEQLTRQEQQKLLRHKEVQEFGVYNREEEETQLQIKALQEDLKKLAQEMAQMASQVQKAIEEEVVHPGTYHVNFFERLRSFVLTLRKKVSESRNWMALSMQRKKKKNYFWGQVKKSGTKFLLSQERYMSTSGG